MTISERIFELIKQRGYTQKEFSKRTGIAESTISDWKKKGTNPVSDKILIICKVLEVNPVWFLSGIEAQGDRGGPQNWFAIDANTDSGKLLIEFNSMDKSQQARLLGYAEALNQLKEQ